MADYTKIPLGRSLNELAQKRAAMAIQNTGRSLPASVVEVVQSGIVTVRFEVDAGQFTLPQVTVPVLGSEYVRIPLQPGAKGFVIAADARLHQMSGLGTGQPDLTQPGNLTALVFAPFGSTSWLTVDNTDRFTVIYGPDGVVVQSADGTLFVRVDSATGLVTMQNGSTSVELSASEVNITGTLIINGDPYMAHQHTGVTTGGGNSGGVL